MPGRTLRHGRGVFQVEGRCSWVCLPIHILSRELRVQQRAGVVREGPVRSPDKRFWDREVQEDLWVGVGFRVCLKAPPLTFRPERLQSWDFACSPINGRCQGGCAQPVAPATTSDLASRMQPVNTTQTLYLLTLCSPPQDHPSERYIPPQRTQHLFPG